MKFNLNEKIKVRLTSSGIKILRESHAQIYTVLGSEVPKFTEPSVDKNGYTEFQLWDFMNIFGEHMNMHTTLPIETNIIIEEEKL